MKNIEIPANEFAYCSSLVDHLSFLINETPDGDFEPEGEDGDIYDLVFPLTFKIDYHFIKRWLRINKIDANDCLVSDSESTPLKHEAPALTNIYYNRFENMSDESEIFSYSITDAFGATAYSITINNKPAIYILSSDGTSMSSFTLQQIIFQK